MAQDKKRQNNESLEQDQNQVGEKGGQVTETTEDQGTGTGSDEDTMAMEDIDFDESGQSSTN